MEQAKALSPDQNAIIRRTQELTDAKISSLQKGSSFIPNPTDINLFKLKCDSDNFVNKLRNMATKQKDENKKECRSTVRFKYIKSREIHLQFRNSRIKTTEGKSPA